MIAKDNGISSCLECFASTCTSVTKLKLVVVTCSIVDTLQHLRVLLYLRVTIIYHVHFLQIWFRASFARTNICDLYAEMV